MKSFVVVRDDDPLDVGRRLLRSSERVVVDVAIESGGPIRGIVWIWADACAAATPVKERVQWDFQADRRQPTSHAIKQVYFLRRRAPLSRSEFCHHWEHVHTSIARAHHPGVSRYTQNTIETPTSCIDGVGELLFPTPRDLERRFFASAASPAIVYADVRQFVDMKASHSVLTREHRLA